VKAVAPSSAADGEAMILEGGRNAALTSLGGSMRRRGMTPQAIEAALLTENAARCKPPLPEGEVREIATSVARYEPTARLREQESSSRTDAFCSSLANGEAERAVLACELSESGSLYRVLPLLKAQDFSQDSHRRIQHAIAELAEAGKPVDELTVTDALLAKGQLASVGGVDYLSSLASNLNTGFASANIEHYAELIVDKSRRRQARAAGARLAHATEDPSVSTDECLQLIEESLLQLEAASGKTAAQPTRELMPAVMNELKTQALNRGLVGMTTGLHSLDLMTGGIRSGELWTIGALAGKGKTALGVEIILA